ncbi:hypothetical protein PITC_030350 [Penicillium italicum]|uniref:Uncharacterized protein n=1 Tax=Penicillium italicum TaxID=40296 RepID=A0A0A2L930_PENIT|nr:hypothetical protein PITC_030350 [Penicillium italicum]
MLPTDAMSTTPSPKKKPEYLGDFTASEIKLIMASVLCISGKLDTDKLGKLSNMKRKSATSRFPSIKRKIEKMFEDQLDTLDDNQNESNAKEGSPAKSRAKKRAGKVVEPQPKAEPEIKTKVESGRSIEDAVKVEDESGDNTDSPVKVDTDSDVEIKLEPLN